MTSELRVPDATCGHCKQTIEGAVVALDGVTEAQLDLESKMLRVTHDDQVDGTLLTSAILDAGYTPESVAASAGPT